MIPTFFWSRSGPTASQATVVQTAVLRHQTECRYVCRQVKQWVWPLARGWHALTGWPQASVERCSEGSRLQAMVSRMMQSAGGGMGAAVACMHGAVFGASSPWEGRRTGEAIGELVATPLHAAADLVGMAGAAVLSSLALLLDTSGALVGTLVGLATAPYVAYDALHRAQS